MSPDLVACLQVMRRQTEFAGVFAEGCHLGIYHRRNEAAASCTAGQCVHIMLAAGEMLGGCHSTGRQAQPIRPKCHSVGLSDCQESCA